MSGIGSPILTLVFQENVYILYDLAYNCLMARVATMNHNLKIFLWGCSDVPSGIFCSMCKTHTHKHIQYARHIHTYIIQCVRHTHTLCKTCVQDTHTHTRTHTHTEYARHMCTNTYSVPHNHTHTHTECVRHAHTHTRAHTYMLPQLWY